MKGIAAICLTAGMALWPHAQPVPFRIVLLPDTQYYASSRPDIFDGQTAWVCANKTALGIAAVLHEGDMVDTYNADAQWVNASHSMAILEACGLPYAIGWGNHDKVPTGNSLIASYFPIARLMNQDLVNWLGHLFFQTYKNNGLPNPPSDRVMAMATRLRAADENGPGILHVGLNYMLDEGLPTATTLEDEPSDLTKAREVKRQLRWLRDLAAAHPSDEIWVTTHADLETPGQNGAAYGDRIAGYDPIAELAYLPSSNIRFVFSGHTLGTQAEAHRVTTRADDSVLNEIVANYQSRPCTGFSKCGNGWLRLLTFDLLARTVQIQTYSTLLNQYETDANSAFTLSY
jgi:hypothetical protein